MRSRSRQPDSGANPTPPYEPHVSEPGNLGNQTTSETRRKPDSLIRCLMTRVHPDGVEDEVLAIRRARAHGALSRIRAKAKADGLNGMTMEQIDAIVAKARPERQGAE